MNDDSSLPRFCREARSQLPALLAGELTGWSERVVRRHFRRCADCAAELTRQEAVSSGLSTLKTRAPAPPPDLLADLLQQARKPGLRGRAAIPARGAVSGARPGLSVGFLTVGALATTGVGWAAWRGGRGLSRRLHRSG
ncbi:MAG: anti-sigma factor family protein [Actinomycetes bacterium]